MIGILLELIQEVKAEDEALQIAKGKYKLPENWRETKDKLNTIWHKKK